MTIREMGLQAKAASIRMAALEGEVKNKAILAVAEALEKHSGEIEAANRLDMAAAGGLDKPLQKRLKYDQTKIAASIEGLRSLSALPDPVGMTQRATLLDDGLELYRVSCPIGVIGVVFESRPDALVQISTLCLKSGNAVLLKGGSEALNSNRILAKIVKEAAISAGAGASSSSSRTSTAGTGRRPSRRNPSTPASPRSSPSSTASGLSA